MSLRYLLTVSLIFLWTSFKDNEVAFKGWKLKINWSGPNWPCYQN